MLGLLLWNPQKKILFNMARIIAIANRKGGVGKTTTAANLGVILANKGYKTLLIDLDDQANLSSLFLDYTPDITIYEAISQDLPQLPKYEISSDLYICPCTTDAAGLDLEIEKKANCNFILKNLLDKERLQFDYILIDCPPALSIININAFVAAQEIFVVTTAEAMPTNGLIQLEKFLNKVEENCSFCASISKIIICRFRGDSVNNIILEQIREEYGYIAADTIIREYAEHRKASFLNKSIIDFAPKSKAAEDYIKLTEEILNN